jgi:hypothetical protein
VVSGSDDFLVQVAASDTRHLEAFVRDHIAQHPHIADVRTSLVYEHLQHLPTEPSTHQPTPPTTAPDPPTQPASPAAMVAGRAIHGRGTRLPAAARQAGAGNT